MVAKKNHTIYQNNKQSPHENEEVKPVEPVHINIYQSNTYRKGLAWLHFNDEPRVQERQQVKDQQPCISIFVGYPTIPSSNQEHQPGNDNSIRCMAVWQIYRDTEQPQEKELHRTNQGSNFLGGSFSNRVNVRAPIQLGRKSQLQHLQRQFFLRHRPIHFHINSTSAIRSVKQNQLSLTSIEINQPLPVPGIFPSTSLQLVNGSKNSILNRVMKLSLFMCFFFISCF